MDIEMLIEILKNWKDTGMQLVSISEDGEGLIAWDKQTDREVEFNIMNEAHDNEEGSWLLEAEI